MKYPLLLTSLLTSFCLVTSHNTLATNNTSVSAENQARWFEIEVILFKQVSKKAEDFEKFTSNDLSAKKRRAFDLLSPYLQPDISALKQLLPNCQQPQAEPLYALTFSPYSLWPETVENTDEANQPVSLTKATEPAEHYNSQALNGPDIKTAPSNMSVKVLATTQGEAKAQTIESIIEPEFTESTFTDPLEAKRVYQVQYANVELPVYNQYPSNKQAPLCVIPAEFFQEQLSTEQLENFNIDGFPVEKLTSTVNAIEQWSADETGEITWASDKPYLISKDSLRLKSITNSIKRSRNYAPLLHLGWRQIGETRRNAKAMHLFAGDNLALDYQQSLAKQNAQQQELELAAILTQRQKAEELALNQLNLVTHEAEQPVNLNVDKSVGTINQNNSSTILINKTQLHSELSIAEQLKQQAKQKKLDEIYDRFSLLTKSGDSDNIDKDSINESEYSEAEIKQMIAQLSFDITTSDAQLTLNDLTDKQNATLKEPVQSWSIDGLFKVHLDHFLFINSEINIIDQSSSAKKNFSKSIAHLANDSVNKDQVISFKQDRRVITGEIHYFDHPHIGMIVQIRRFDPTKPADEAVSQVKK